VDAALALLRERFGGAAFEIVEQWDTDLCVVGIAGHDRPARLVYVSTCEKEPGRFDVALERAAPEGSSDLYVEDGAHHDVEFDSLAQIVGDYLGLRAAEGPAA
jgi:hypothetical protein